MKYRTDYRSTSLASFSDYYPFGMQMPGRKMNGGDYRYGYQGSEMDNEVAGEGNSYTTHYRLLDPRIGRWRSLDPKMAKYPNKSPYISMSNNPVIKIDPNGDDDYYYAAGKYLGTWDDGTKSRVIKASERMAYIVADFFFSYMEAGYEKQINKKTSIITLPTSEAM